jgi:hypothetical protein
VEGFESSDTHPKREWVQDKGSGEAGEGRQVRNREEGWRGRERRQVRNREEGGEEGREGWRGRERRQVRNREEGGEEGREEGRGGGRGRVRRTHKPSSTYTPAGTPSATTLVFVSLDAIPAHPHNHNTSHKIDASKIAPSPYLYGGTARAGIRMTLCSTAVLFGNGPSGGVFRTKGVARGNRVRLE